MQTRCRHWCHALHQHLGLWVGVLFVLLGLTGSLLTFYTEIDTLLNPSITPREQGGGQVSVQKVYDVLRHAYPDNTGSWQIELPMANHQAIGARYRSPEDMTHSTFAPLMVTVDPVTYQITSARRWGSYAATWVYDLHYTLLADAWGHNAVGLLGLLVLITLVLGLWLWMPPWRRLMQRLSPVIRSQPVKTMYDIHMLAGIYGGACLALLALTGIILSFPNASKHLASTVLPFEEPMPTFSRLLQPGEHPANLDALITSAHGVFPRAEVRWIETSGEDGREVTLRLFSGDEPSRRFPQTYLKLHPQTGAVLHQRHYHQLQTGDQWWAWVHPLHNGEALGLAGRVLVALLGLFPVILMVTGVLRFFQKRKARRRIRAMRSAGDHHPC
ncbi:MAG: PepSY domain-containing protein [Limnohabitans sp.]|nr:PepSY domain-containing protein [Limnohabitans sp.]